MMQPAAFGVTACFDLDGVVVDSEDTKIAAFLAATVEVLSLDEEEASWVDRYNRTHRGIPRRLKFHTIVQRVAPRRRDEAVEELLRAYARELKQRLPEAPAMPGAREFVASWRGRRVLVTSAPRSEASWQLQRLRMLGIDQIFDGSMTKSDALRVVAAGGLPVVFFGDAGADLDAAREAGVAFVAVGEAFRREEVTSDEIVIAHVASLQEATGREYEIALAATVGVQRDSGTQGWP